jgi:RNA polymerase sigma factor (sigma-70 family)
LHKQHVMAHALDVNLTGRERQIVDALLRALSNKEIAQHLGVSDQTVKNQLTRLYRKIGVSGRVDLMLWAAKRRIATFRE